LLRTSRVMPAKAGIQPFTHQTQVSRKESAGYPLELSSGRPSAGPGGGYDIEI